MIELDNGAIVLQMVAKEKDGIVLARWPGKGEFIVWHFYKCYQTGKYFCEHGNYFTDLEKAEETFQLRAERFMGWK